jgi:hypothetical protein
MITEDQADIIAEVLYDSLFDKHVKAERAVLAVDEPDDNAIIKATVEARREMSLEFDSLNHLRDQIHDVIRIFFKWLGLSRLVTRGGFDTRRDTTEILFAYITSLGFGIWPMELDWEDTGRFVGHEALRRSIDRFVATRLENNPGAIAQYDLMQRYYIERATKYEDALVSIREWFVDAWNDTWESDLGASAYYGIELPDKITLELFDEWWDDQDGDLDSMYYVLDLWVSGMN